MSEEKEAQRKAGLALVGKLVFFRHRPEGVGVALVTACDPEGMVELQGMAGKFAPHLFEVADGDAGPLDELPGSP